MTPRLRQNPLPPSLSSSVYLPSHASPPPPRPLHRRPPEHLVIPLTRLPLQIDSEIVGRGVDQGDQISHCLDAVTYVRFAVVEVGGELSGRADVQLLDCLGAGVWGEWLLAACLLDGLVHCSWCGLIRLADGTMRVGRSMKRAGRCGAYSTSLAPLKRVFQLTALLGLSYIVDHTLQRVRVFHKDSVDHVLQLLCKGASTTVCWRVNRSLPAFI